MSGLKITRLQAENVKRIKAVDITPKDEAVITVGGKNGAGKTSVLDTLSLAFSYSEASKDIPKPIREGKDKAYIIAETEDYKVTRTFTPTGSYLKVENKDGAKFGSPQALLDSLVGKLAFDPLKFANMDAAQQKKVLMDLIGLSHTMVQLDKERNEVFNQRTIVNRELKNLNGLVAGLPMPEGDIPEKEINSSEVMAELEAAMKEKQANDGCRRNRDNQEKEVERVRRELKRVEDEIAELLREKEELEHELVEAKDELEGLEKAVAELVDPDIESLRKKVAGVDEANKRFRAAQKHLEAKAAVEKKKEEANSLTARLEEIDKQKEDALRNAQFPIDGLGFDEVGVTLNGIPFCQLSQSEKLKVSLAMAMALNPKLKVIRITDGSLLDNDNMNVIREMAKDKGYQVWIEAVTEDRGKVSVFIEDGEIKGGQLGLAV